MSSSRKAASNGSPELNEGLLKGGESLSELR
jgi:hypothetical protein